MSIHKIGNLIQIPYFILTAVVTSEKKPAGVRILFLPELLEISDLSSHV